MDPKDLKRILDALQDADVNDFSLETPEFKLALKRGQAVVVTAPAATPVVQAPAPVVLQAAPPVAAPVAAPSATQAPAAEATTETPATGTTIKAPIVGTFYRAAAPDQPNFVEVGTRVEIGQVLCIVEAMKLMNEIESEHAGVVKQILVQNGQPVEYGQPLFVLE